MTMWWNYLAAFFFGRALAESPTYRRVTRILFLVVLVGVLICGLIYAYLMFDAVYKQALKERSNPSHVHTRRSH